MEENKQEKQRISDIPNFINLIKCIIEYYASTRAEDPNIHISKTDLEINDDNMSLTDQLKDAENLLQNIGSEFDMDSMVIKIPKRIDSEIRKSFMFQLKQFNQNS